jgi:hypothetical protein
VVVAGALEELVAVVETELEVAGFVEVAAAEVVAGALEAAEVVEAAALLDPAAVEEPAAEEPEAALVDLPMQDEDPELMVKAADDAVVPVLSRIVNPMDVPAAMSVAHV